MRACSSENRPFRFISTKVDDGAGGDCESYPARAITARSGMVAVASTCSLRVRHLNALCDRSPGQGARIICVGQRRVTRPDRLRMRVALYPSWGQPMMPGHLHAIAGATITQTLAVRYRFSLPPDAHARSPEREQPRTTRSLLRDLFHLRGQRRVEMDQIAPPVAQRADC
jgi:hypothetical protein